MVKDEERKQQVKHYFNIWYKAGLKYWKELQKSLNENREAEYVYEELSAILYETSSKLIETERTDELLQELKTLLKRY